MTPRLHPVLGGELLDSTAIIFKDINAVHIAGRCPDLVSARLARAQRTVDHARMRSCIAPLPMLRDAEMTGD